MSEDPQRISLLIQQLSNNDSTLRKNAVIELGECGDAKAFDALTQKALTDGDLYIRGIAIQTLGDIGNPNALPVIVQAFENGSQELRVYAAYSLSKFGDDRGFTYLTDIVEGQIEADLFQTVYLLGILKDARAESALIDILFYPVASLRRLAISGLGNWGTARALPALEWSRQYDWTCPNHDPRTISHYATEAIYRIESRLDKNKHSNHNNVKLADVEDRAINLNMPVAEYADRVRKGMREGWNVPAELATMVENFKTLEGLKFFVGLNATKPKIVQLSAIWLNRHDYGSWSLRYFLEYVPALAHAYLVEAHIAQFAEARHMSRTELAVWLGIDEWTLNRLSTRLTPQALDRLAVRSTSQNTGYMRTLADHYKISAEKLALLLSEDVDPE